VSLLPKALTLLFFSFLWTEFAFEKYSTLAGGEHLAEK
jgi:hypothetical protein